MQNSFSSLILFKFQKNKIDFLKGNNKFEIDIIIIF